MGLGRARARSCDDACSTAGNPSTPGIMRKDKGLIILGVPMIPTPNSPLFNSLFPCYSYTLALIRKSQPSSKILSNKLWIISGGKDKCNREIESKRKHLLVCSRPSPGKYHSLSGEGIVLPPSPGDAASPPCPEEELPLSLRKRDTIPPGMGGVWPPSSPGPSLENLPSQR